MAEGEAVQGNTESVSADGVYSDTQQAPQEGGADLGLDAASQAAAEMKPETPAEPIQYKFEMPEGIEANQAAIDAFIPIMQKLGIPQEAAQEIVNIQANIAKESKVAHEQAINTAREQWVKDITSDPELGGEKLKETLHVANQGLKQVATEGFIDLLQKTGLGDHPEVIRVFHKLGKALGDDEFVRGSPGGQKGIGSMYNNSPELK